MFKNRETLIRNLGDEFVLGMDIFDVDDIWDVLHNEKLEDLQSLANDVRAYVAEKYKEGVTHTKEFIDRQVDTWILQYKWRYMHKKCDDCLVGQEFYPNEGGVLISEKDIAYQRERSRERGKPEEFNTWIDGKDDMNIFGFLEFCPNCGHPVDSERLGKHESKGHQ